MLLKTTLIIFIYFLINVSADEYSDEYSDEDHYHPILEAKANAKAIKEEEKETAFWINNAQALLDEKLKIVENTNTNTAKNIIMFLGDGMSMATVAATRMFLGGEELKLSFEEFPTFGYSKTYCVNRQVADSACTATAYLSGVKGNYGTIGVNAKVPRYNCKAEIDKRTHTEPITKWAQDAGKATGFVTTTRVTHASPAGLYAHTANRDWENDVSLRDAGCDPNLIQDISYQLIHGEVGSKFKVILGGGRSEFLNSTVLDEENKAGWRSDGKNLIEEWKSERSKDGNATYVTDKSELQSINLETTDYLLGLFEGSHCKYAKDIEREGVQDIKPKLTDMVKVAIELLQKSEKGYFLFVEGGQIDMAHHDTKARKSLEETVEFDNAVKLAQQLTNASDTLIVVTADHSHTMTISGYPTRGSDILGIGDIDSDKKEYTTLSYANGPSYSKTYNADGTRKDISTDDFTDPNTLYISHVPLSSESHAGDDVGIYASGPWNHIFSGTVEQTAIPIKMAYAAKIGPYVEKGGAATIAQMSIFIMSLLSFLTIYMS